MNNYATIGMVSALIVLSSACAHMPPKELSDARSTYARAATGPAGELTPADLHKAKVALDQAERAFRADPDAQTTKDLAYVAERKSQTAEVRAQHSLDERDRLAAEAAYQEQQAQAHRDTKAELSMTKDQLAKGNLAHVRDAVLLNDANNALKNAEDKTLTAEQKAASAEEKTAMAEGKTAASEAKNKELQAALVKLAAFKEESRGMVLTLSGSVLFVSNEATLLPGAQTKLNQIADALESSGKRKVVVEGHTDSQGGDKANMDLSQRRADAVRSYIVSRGFPSERISASGIGEARPITSNKNAEGRANNRRVELVILPM